MIRVTAASPFVVEAREFKSNRGVVTYLRSLKRLQKAHIEAAVAKELGPLPDARINRWGNYEQHSRNARRSWRLRFEEICKSQPLKISIVHV